MSTIAAPTTAASSTTALNHPMSSGQGSSKLRVAVIGAGCSGLAAIKECLAEPDHFEVVGFEQDSHVGGLWRFVEVSDENPNPHSSVYKSTIINTSKDITTFSDYAIPASWPAFLPNKKMAQYFDMYAKHFDLQKHIRFRTKVVEIRELKDAQNRWMVRSHPIPPASETTKTEPTIQEEIFDRVLMCTGHHSAPRYPTFPGMNSTDPDAYTGQQLHSHFYREVPEDLKGKNVVIVGFGASAADLAVELSMNQCQVHLSTRSPVWVVPRWLGGKPLDHVLSRFSYCLPPKVLRFATSTMVKWSSPKVHPKIKPTGPLFQTQPTINSLLHERISTGTIVPQVNVRRIGPGKRVEFEDDTVLEDIDAIYWCTGYNVSFPALDPTIVSDGHQDLDKNRVWLWNYMLPPRHPNLAFIGLFQPSGAFMPVIELQCRFMVQAWAGKSPDKKNPLIPTNAEQMDKEIQATQRQIRARFDDTPRHTIQLSFLIHSDNMAKRMGCYPTYRKLIKAFGLVEGTRLKKEAMFGTATPAFYRLVGPHCWTGGAADKDVMADKEMLSNNESSKYAGRRRQVGEAARQVIWGYKGHAEYVNSKYLRDESQA
ncbi:flavin monooxygenase-like protein [Mortierella sp. GBAus27b]|nr:Cyclopentanone 1,2-monooxygenase (CPMO) [Mortierella sp. GBA43]KAI8348152.1 flavin monooxygenase-like protein [Mortierella sp. GBAus27b]